MLISFKNIRVLGGGLLGGSLALALQEKHNVKLWFRRVEGIQLAKDIGLTTATDDLAESVQSADLLILAVPIGSMPDLLRLAICKGLPATCLVTDVGSVKAAPHRDLAEVLAIQNNPFIGSHPMAGSERNGVGAARADLFQNAACLLTNDSSANQLLCEKLESFWQAIGCRTTWLTAVDHDHIVSKISHLPHVTAAATAYAALAEDPNSGRFSGGGLRDTIRVAGGNPEMWTEILMENRSEVSLAIREMISKLEEFRIALEKQNTQQLHQLLTEAKMLRNSLP